jgi:hypothetical protein
MRSCHKKSYFFWVETRCDSWRDVPAQTGDKFPAFDSRAFDQACRKEKLANIAKAEKLHGQAVKTGTLVDTNFGSSFKGLQNFSPTNRRRRRLQGSGPETAVEEVVIEEFIATANGLPLESVNVNGQYTGAQLKSDDVNVNSIQQAFQSNLDFSDYKNPGGGTLPTDDGAAVRRTIQQGAAGKYLDALEYDDEFLSKQPIIAAPKLQLAPGSPGERDKPVTFDCISDDLAEAWLNKLESFEPESLRRKRYRRSLQAGPIEETLVEVYLERRLESKIRASNGIQVVAHIGGVGGGQAQDLFVAAKGLLGTEGAGAFMNPDRLVARRRRLQDLSLDDFDLHLDLTRAEPFCDRFEWTFAAAISDATGKSDPIDINAVLYYGTFTLENGPPTSIQTRCDSTKYGVEDLEDNKSLKFFQDIDTFKPALNLENCPSPYFYLEPDEDSVINEGEPCTTNYTQIQRKWNLRTHDTSCELPFQVQTPFFQQTITLGGLTYGEPGMPALPATPTFELQAVNYFLSNERDNGSAIFELDDVLDPGSISDECGICNIETTLADESVLGCDQVGLNTASVTITNLIGIKVTKDATVKVFDEHPPVSQPKIPFPDVDLDLTEHASVSPHDIDDDSYDNCGIADRSLSRLSGAFNDACRIGGDACDFSCSDTYGGGPFDVYLTVTDPSGNTAQNSTSIKVLDSSDRDGDGFYDCAESLLFFTDPDEPDKAYAIDTAPDSENLPAVFPYRPAKKDPWKNKDPCAGEEIMGTIYELKGDGTMAPSSGSGSSYCPTGHLDFIEAQVVWPWIQQDSGVDSGSKVAVKAFADTQDQEKLELEGKLFDVDKKQNLLKAKKVPEKSYFTRLVLTDTEAAMYARQVSQPIVRVTVRCHSKKKSPKKTSDPPGMLFFRLSADHPACPGRKGERVQDVICPGGLTVADYDGLRNAPACHAVGDTGTLRKRKLKPQKLKNKPKTLKNDIDEDLGVDYYITKSGKKESTCVLDRMGGFCRKDFIVEKRFCMNECINYDDKDVMLGKGLESDQEYPVCCKA